MPLTREDNLYASLEDGYTRIPNRLLEAMVFSNLNRAQLMICLFILRCTNGWNRDDVAISLNDIAAAYGCSVSYAAREMRTLLQMNVVRRVGFQPGKIPFYTINFFISQWDESYLDLDRLEQKIADGIFKKSELEVPGLHPGSDPQVNLELQGDSNLEFNGVSNHRCLGDTFLSLEPPEFEEGLKKGLKKYKKRSIYSGDSIEFQLSQLLLLKILEHIPGHKLPDLQKWSEEMNLLIRVDKRLEEEIREVILFAQNDSFWKNNILSVRKLRKHYDTLNGKRLSGSKSSAANRNLRGKNDREKFEEADEYKNFYS